MGKKVALSTKELMAKTFGRGKGGKGKGRKKKGAKARKAQSRAAQRANEKRAEALGPQPKSFVFRRGVAGQCLKRLVLDMRRVMMPETALKLKEQRANTLKDFVDAAVELDVTHLLCFSESQTTGNTYLRIGRVAHGPTLTFEVVQYSLSHAVQTLRSRGLHAMSPGSAELRTAPVVVLNNMSAGGQAMHLAAVALQNMFAAINLDTVRLRECRRVVLFHYDAESDTVQFRHYLITAAPSGINRNLRRIVQNKDVPLDALGRARDIADFVLGPAAASESEASDMEECKVALPQDFVGSGNVAAASASERSTIRLVELGPRMQLKLVRVQEGLFDGNVLLGTRDTHTLKAENARVKHKRAAVLAKVQKRAQEQQALEAQRTKARRQAIQDRLEKKRNARDAALLRRPAKSKSKGTDKAAPPAKRPRTSK